MNRTCICVDCGKPIRDEIHVNGLYRWRCSPCHWKRIPARQHRSDLEHELRVGQSVAEQAVDEMDQGR